MRLVSVVTRTRSLLFGANANFLEQVVHLALDRANFDFRIDQAGRTNHLLDEYAAGFRQLVRAGRGGNVDHLIGAMLEFLESKRAIVQRATACGSRSPRAFACASDRRDTCRAPAEWSGAIRR